MSWGGGRRWKLGKSLLSKATSLVDVADDDDDDNSGGEGSSNALSGLLGGGYDEDDDAGDGGQYIYVHKKVEILLTQ